MISAFGPGLAAHLPFQKTHCFSAVVWVYLSKCGHCRLKPCVRVIGRVLTNQELGLIVNSGPARRLRIKHVMVHGQVSQLFHRQPKCRRDLKEFARPLAISLLDGADGPNLNTATF